MAANTLNRVLLLLSAHFCFNKNFFIDLLRLSQFFQTFKKIAGTPNFFDILPVRWLKMIENH